MAIVVTLICGYFGAWEATERWGVPKTYDTKWELVEKHGDLASKRIVSAYSPMPFVICRDEAIVLPFTIQELDVIIRVGERPIGRQKYLWLFGLKVKLNSDSHSRIDRDEIAPSPPAERVKKFLDAIGNK